jgi:hypothetical protein
MVNKIEYSAWIGVKKAAVNNLVTLGPFALAVLAAVPPKYAVIASFLAYMIKNYISTTSRGN